jgi:alpha-amylase
LRKICSVLAILFLFVFPVLAVDPPVAIFHAFDQPFSDVAEFVCDLPGQGYTHVQIPPAQKSNPTDQWWGRYQPVDYKVIEGRGSEAELRSLVAKAHACGMKVIADVVFNHMANMCEYRGLDFPGMTKDFFHEPCPISYSDGNRTSEMDCRLGELPDLNHNHQPVRMLQKGHLKNLLEIGIDGFRFDAAKHMPPQIVQSYIDYINQESGNRTWNYLEVIEDQDTKAEDYNTIAAVTDFLLYGSMKDAFSYGGDLRWLRYPRAVQDSRSVTFGRNHDTIRELNPFAINPYDDRYDSYMATSYVLAREGGTPLVLSWDNIDSPLVRHGVKFRQIMAQRGAAGRNVKENYLSVVDSSTLMVMERGSEGFFVVNKSEAKYDVPVLDLTLTNLEGCYRELRHNFNVAIEKRRVDDGQEKKYVTRWGTPNRGGMEVSGRDVLYFIREPWSQCLIR